MHIHDGSTLASVTRSAFTRRGFLATTDSGTATTVSAHGTETHQ